MTGKKRYKKGKEAARNEAIEWQLNFSENSHSWEDIAEAGAHFETLGKRYGLIREFKENGIL